METVTVKKTSGPKLDFKNGRIDLSHGSGGRATAQLIDQLFRKCFDNEWLAQQNDQAQFLLTHQRCVMTTDAHVISPIFFPGGDIGSLSVHGTINDLAMSGARPLYLTAAFILEEGFPLADLRHIVESMAEAAKAANVAIIAGDTKVVERGKADNVFITTAGFGVVPEGIFISGDRAQVGDEIILSGTMGDHGVAILSHRENLSFSTTIQSDTAALHDLVATMIQVDPTIHCLRDPTRGGVATTLNELAQQSSLGIIVDESQVPVREEVASACELLGLDPFYIANEGKLIAICKAKNTEKLLRAMRQHFLGINAQCIGRVVADPQHFVQLKTKMGGMRMMDKLAGEQLPRIC